MLTLHLLGPLRLIDGEGQSFLPTGSKAQAILAMLAAAAQHRRARSWLQDKLWSDRPPKQGAASLRQSLSEIRKSLGPYRGALRTGNGMVTLDTSQVNIVTEADEDGLGFSEYEPLHGLDIRDPEFEDWIRDFRASFARHAVPGPQQATEEPVLMLEQDPKATGGDAWFGAAFGAQVARTLNDLGTIKHVHAQPQGLRPLHGLSLSSRNFQDAGTWHTMLQLETLNEQRVIWSAARSIKLSGGVPLEELETQELGQQAVVEIMLWMARQNGQNAASVLTAKALQQIFTLDVVGLNDAETLLCAAYKLEPRGVILAWQAFLRLTQILEFHHADAAALEADAQKLIAQACADAPNNAVVAAIAAQVRLLVDRDPKGALHFARRGVDLDKTNPLAWGYYALAMAHLGKPDKAYISAKRARYLAQSSPFVFWWDMLCCLTSLSAGHMNEATSFAENVRARVPHYRPALRYLYPLYRAQNKMTSASNVLTDLIRAEPGFQLSHYQDATYPVATLRKTRLAEMVDRLA